METIPGFANGGFTKGSSSYPTYEEWKRDISEISSRRNSRSSYPTYEEWKQGFGLDMADIEKVLILPMRNGNTFSKNNYSTFCFVLILPMRNGNLTLFFYQLHTNSNQFLSYL